MTPEEIAKIPVEERIAELRRRLADPANKDYHEAFQRKIDSLTAEVGMNRKRTPQEIRANIDAGMTPNEKPSLIGELRDPNAEGEFLDGIWNGVKAIPGNVVSSVGEYANHPAASLRQGLRGALFGLGDEEPGTPAYAQQMEDQVHAPHSRPVGGLVPFGAISAFSPTTAAVVAPLLAGGATYAETGDPAAAAQALGGAAVLNLGTHAVTSAWRRWKGRAEGWGRRGELGA
jgi:hypothetical protein